MLVDLAEHFWGLPFLLLEDAVEVRDVVESAVVADFRYGCGGVYQHPGGVAEAHVNNVV